jgi:hypothetical protein
MPDDTFMTAGYATASGVVAAILTFLSTRNKVRASTEVAVRDAVYDGFTKLVGGLQTQIDHINGELRYCRETHERDQETIRRLLERLGVKT